MVSRHLGAPRRWSHRAVLLTLLAPSFASADIVMPDERAEANLLEELAKAPASAPESAPTSAPESAPASAPEAAPATAPASAAPSAPATTAAAAETGMAAEATAATAGMSRFEKTERLESLRYRNLWIGYAAIWLIIFAFIWRTWKRTVETGRELNALREKLDALEARQGKGEA